MPRSISRDVTLIVLLFGGIIAWWSPRWYDSVCLAPAIYELDASNGDYNSTARAVASSIGEDARIASTLSEVSKNYDQWRKLLTEKSPDRPPRVDLEDSLTKLNGVVGEAPGSVSHEERSEALRLMAGIEEMIGTKYEGKFGGRKWRANAFWHLRDAITENQANFRAAWGYGVALYKISHRDPITKSFALNALNANLGDELDFSIKSLMEFKDNIWAAYLCDLLLTQRAKNGGLTLEEKDWRSQVAELVKKARIERSDDIANAEKSVGSVR